MTSTRNKNTQGNYNLEKLQDKKINNYLQFKEFGNNQFCALPDLYLPSYVPSSELSKNAVDVESYLRGTHSVDLENHQKNNFFNPIQKTPNYVEFFERNKVILPNPLIIENNQRPLFN